MNRNFDLDSNFEDELLKEALEEGNEQKHERTRAERRKNNFKKSARKAKIWKEKHSWFPYKSVHCLNKRGLNNYLKPKTRNIVWKWEGELFSQTYQRLGKNYKASDKKKIISLNQKLQEYRLEIEGE